MAGVCLYPFSLQNVTNVIYGDIASGRNLDDAHNDADINLYDPEYIGGQNTLYNFRNYGCGTLNLTAASSGCSDETLYYSVKSDNQNTSPEVGDSFEVDMGSGTTDTFIGGGLYYNYLFNGSFYRIEINNSGEVTNVQTC